MEILTAFGIAIAAFAAAVVGGVAGIGTAIVLLPLLTLVFGVREAIPIVSVAMVITNLSRIWFNRHEVHYGLAGWFLLGGIPAAVLGAIVFTTAPAAFLARLLGVFLLLVVVERHLPFRRHPRLGSRSFVMVGGAQGFISALVGVGGPVGAPFFLAYGLARGAFVGTMALGMAGLNAVKAVTYGGYALLDAQALSIGLALGAVMFVGTAAGRVIVTRIPERLFPYVVEAVLVVAGLAFVIRG